MRLRKLFFLLLALPLAFAACQKSSEAVDEPIDQDPVLTITSESVLKFDAQGGEAEITYTLEYAGEGAQPKATCEAKWVEVKVGNTIRVTVAANDGEAREAKIIVTYGPQDFEVAVKQEAKGAEPEKEYLFDEELAYAERMDLRDYGFPANYYLVAFYTADGNILFGSVLVGAEGEEILSAGTYTSDNGGLMMEGFELYVGETEEYFFEGGSGVVVVGGDINGYTFDFDISNAEGQNFHFTYEGVVEDMELPANVLPTEDVVLEASFCEGEYYGTEYSDTYNYYLLLSDLGSDEDGYAYAGGTYYQVDLYSVEGTVDAEGYIHVPAGTYTFDVNDTMAEWTLGNYYSGYFKINADGTAYEGKGAFEAGKAVVTENGITLEVMVGGVKHTVTYNGEPKLYVGGNGGGGETPTPGEGVEFTANYAYAMYYGDQYTPGTADNYYFFLSDLGVDADGYDYAGGTYYRFDIYAPITSDYTITPGTYTIDVNDSMAAGTVGAYYSAYYKWNSYGDDYDATDWPDGGFITFNEDGSIYAEVHMMASGETHKVSFAGGDIVIYDGTGGGEGGGGEYGIMSTLTDDYTATLDHHTLVYEFYGDYYYIGLQNWTFMIAPNEGEGEYVQFDVLAGPDSTDFNGTYAISSEMESYTSYPGVIEGGNMGGSWLYSSDYYTMSPFVDGTLTITNNNNGTYSVSFDVTDDAGYNVTGSWTGETLDYGTMSTRSVVLKEATKYEAPKTLNIEKSRLVVNKVNRASAPAPAKGLKLR